MALVSGPGRGGSLGQDHKSLDAKPDKVHLAVEKHVEYIKSLDTVGSVHT